MFYLKYLKSLIINNPIKIIYILLIIIPFSFFLKERNIFINNKYYIKCIIRDFTTKEVIKEVDLNEKK